MEGIYRKSDFGDTEAELTDVDDSRRDSNVSHDKNIHLKREVSKKLLPDILTNS